MNKAQAEQFKRLVFRAVDEAVVKMNLNSEEIDVTVNVAVQDNKNFSWPEES